MARSPSAETRHHVDVHVGKQLALARHTQGLNQSDVARMLGLTFQQIQKYEKGSNRMS
ncbi:helix-turn-helix transcriptional regulator, partial [Acinetobacter baumannii]